MFPGGHSKCTNVSDTYVLRHKFKKLGKLALGSTEMVRFMISLANISEMSNEELQDIYYCSIRFSDEPIDDLQQV